MDSPLKKRLFWSHTQYDEALSILQPIIYSLTTCNFFLMNDKNNFMTSLNGYFWQAVIHKLYMMVYFDIPTKKYIISASYLYQNSAN
jgi:hypothetical protein